MRHDSAVVQISEPIIGVTVVWKSTGFPSKLYGHVALSEDGKTWVEQGGCTWEPKGEGFVSQSFQFKTAVPAGMWIKGWACADQDFEAESHFAWQF